MTGRFTIGLFDHRNARSVLRGDHVANLVSPGGVELIGVEEVWEKLTIYDLRRRQTGAAHVRCTRYDGGT